MSATSTDSLDIQEQIVRIKRAQQESDKFVAEQRKLMAEADKLRRDRFLAPILAAGALGGFIAALLPYILRGWGIR